MQVVGWASKSKKSEAEQRSMAMALCRTSEGLEKLLAAKAPTSDLQETHLDKAAPWLGSLSSSSTQMLLGHLLDAKRTHAVAYAKL